MEAKIIAAAKALCEKFIAKVEDGRAKSVETYAECKALLKMIKLGEAHRSNPCIFCGVSHGDVEPGSCPARHRQEEKLDGIRKAIQQVIDYPIVEQGRRDKDGYPTEFVYDEYAYKRVIDSARSALRTILNEFKD